MSVFSSVVGHQRSSATRAIEFLVMQLFAILVFAATIPIAGVLAESRAAPRR